MNKWTEILNSFAATISVDIIGSPYQALRIQITKITILRPEYFQCIFNTMRVHSQIDKLFILDRQRQQKKIHDYKYVK